MRRALLLILLLVSASVLAQAQRLPKLEPLPEPPPPPPMQESDEPRVNIPVQKGDKVEEARDSSGRIIAIKVTPPGGTPYYLIDVTGAGQWERRDSLNPDFRVPMWTIRTFD
ncbi:MAG TPA: DUF2782 domain-containing protein [Burkholderiales bacterium]|nr:DUF2782 domain-containing protein [Burkholderiales bacterium]